MGGLVRLEPGRATTCSLLGGRGIGELGWWWWWGGDVSARQPQPVTGDSVGRGGREPWQQRPTASAKRGGISRMWLELGSAQFSAR